jgi:hypothetical protein
MFFVQGSRSDKFCEPRTVAEMSCLAQVGLPLL